MAKPTDAPSSGTSPICVLLALSLLANTVLLSLLAQLYSPQGGVAGAAGLLGPSQEGAESSQGRSGPNGREEAAEGKYRRMGQSGASAAIGCSPEEVLKSKLAVAEQIYQRNLARRGKLTGSNETATFPLDAAASATFVSERGSVDDVSMREYMLTPMYPCTELERVGRWGDGGKWICLQSLHKRPEDIVVYSIGSCGDPSFEAGMWDLLHVTTDTFDPFMTEAEEQRITPHSFIRLHKVALSTGGSTVAMDVGRGKQAPAKGIHELLKDLNHTFVDVFKIDCEGCEIQFVEDLAKKNVQDKPLFGQIQMEIHRALDLPEHSLLFQRLHNLGYRTFNLEPNLYGAGIVFEVAFIHESLC